MEDNSFDNSNPELSANTPEDTDGSSGQLASTHDSDPKTTELASRETSQVRKLRLLLIAVLFLVATGTSLGLYFFTRSSEKTEFETSFKGQGNKLIGGFQDDSLRKLQAVDSLSTRLTAFAIDTNKTWPFVTVSNSAELLEPYRLIAGAASVQVMPIVEPRLRDDWEQYAMKNQGWINQDLLKSEGQVTTQQETNAISKYIKDYIGVDTTPGRWVVWWQYAPVLPDTYFINFNRLAWDGFDREMESVERKQAVLSETWTFEASLNTQSTRAATFMDELLSAGGSGSYEPGEPIGYIHYPIFDKFEESTKKTVAVLTATVYWRSFFEDILPETVSGIDCVVSNSLGQVFTYRVQGREATFMGMEDAHDRNYDHLEITAKYGDLVNDQDKDVYTGVNLDNSYVSYSIRAYPTKELEKQYVTERPYLYAATLFFVFLFTIALFTLYDCIVEKRQKIVLSTAIKTTAVVESLFPKTIRDRLMEEAGMKDDPENADNTNHGPADKPIADFFPETTIMFADLVGFTACKLLSVTEPDSCVLLHCF